ncbi:cupin [Desulfobacterales bacterium HSG16]|nr:cupin [Desulfobacterales bacterium HSG16]
MNEITDKISNGKVVDMEKEINAGTLKWNPHPAFEGVYLKHLVTGDMTDSKFSCHLVKIENGHEIGEHIHEKNWELHEPVDGLGRGFLAEKEIEYVLGVSVVIPEGVKHRIVAVDGDFYLLAKFIPALV